MVDVPATPVQPRIEGTNQSIARYVVRDVPVAHAGTPCTVVLDALRRDRHAYAADVFVTDANGRLVGAVELAALLAASLSGDIAGIARTITEVQLDIDREAAASLSVHTGDGVLAVCGADGRFAGAVPPAALLSILREEHLEDLHHMAGILAKSRQARLALHDSPGRRALYRLPWLLVGMAGSAVATMVMASYEEALKAQIAVAFFVPAIVYLADAIGTQSEAVAVRGLSLSGAGIRRSLAAEIGTGLIIGGTLGVIAFLAVALGFGDTRLAAAVGGAVVAAGAVATAVGTLLPWIFDALHLDPAYGSGPLATVIQDVMSLLIYFAIADALIM